MRPVHEPVRHEVVERARLVREGHHRRLAAVDHRGERISRWAELLVPADDDPDARVTACALADAIAAIEARDGAFDLVLFGNESADRGAYQVGIRVAHALGRPVVTGAKALAVHDDHVEVRREAGDGYEVYRLPRPAAVGVLEGINLPRYATLPGRLRSKKAAIDTEAPPIAASTVVTDRFEVPEEVVTETVTLADAAAVVDLLVGMGLA